MTWLALAAEIGLNYSDFMRMTAAEVQAYADGYQRKANREAWLQGIYTQDALTAIASAVLAGKNKQNVYKYPERPHGELQPMTEEERLEEEEAERLRAKLYMMQMAWAYKNWGNDGKTNS